MDNRLVYVVDDDPDMLRSAGFLLQSMGYRYECFPDGADFLAALPRLQPGCVLTDLRMPRVDGFELRSKLAEQSIGWPVILMTSDSGPGIADEARSRGFTAFLAKPFSADQVASALDGGFKKFEAGEG